MNHVIAPGHIPRMRLLPRAFDVEPLNAQLDAHPELWNEHTFRTANKLSPHREVDDIWVRYNAIENLDLANPRAFNDKHEGVWYPSATQLPAARQFAVQLASELGASAIGAVLITRIPPNRQVHWHLDSSWHAAAHRKFLLLVRGHIDQSFEFEGEQLYTQPGEVFEFKNEFPHRVLNPTAVERISLIVCLRDFAPQPSA